MKTLAEMYCDVQQNRLEAGLTISRPDISLQSHMLQLQLAVSSNPFLFIYIYDKIHFDLAIPSPRSIVYILYMNRLACILYIPTKYLCK